MRKLLLSLLIFSCALANAQNEVAILGAKLLKSSKSNSDKAAVAATPFQLHRGLIYVDANLNGTLGKFILDTGAPGLVLNQLPTGEMETGVGISHTVDIAKRYIEQLTWLNYQQRNLEGYAIDLSGFMPSSTIPLHGLIGYDALRDKALTIDYAHKVILQQDSKTLDTKSISPVAVIPITMHGHLPVVRLRVGNNKLRFGIDTGSTVVLLDKNKAAQLQAYFNEATEADHIRGLANTVEEVEKGTLSQLQMGDLIVPNQKVLLVDFANLHSQSDFHLDGLLGYDFFANRRITIDYKKRKLYIW